MMSQEKLDTSPTSGASPGHSPFYNRLFWAAYKGVSRGQWSGVVLGVAIGAAIGGVLAGGLALIPGITMTTGLALGVIGMSSFAGMSYYKDIFGMSGAAAGAVAAGLEIAEERTREKEHKGVSVGKAEDVSTTKTASTPDEAINEAIPAYVAPHPQDFNADPRTEKNDKGDMQWFFPAVVLSGAVIGGLFGLSLSWGGEEFFSKALEGLVSDPTNAAKLSSGLLVGGGALAGASFGINRNIYRIPVNFVNALYEGDLKEFSKQRGNRLERKRELKAQKYEAIPEKTFQAEQLTSFDKQSNRPGTQVSYFSAEYANDKPVTEKRFAGSWTDFQEEAAKQAAQEEPGRIH